MTEVEEWVAEHGVTRCPTAFCAASMAEITPEDAAAHCARGIDPLGDMWRAKKAEAKRAKTAGLFGWAAYWAKKRAKEAADDGQMSNTAGVPAAGKRRQGHG